MFYRDVLTHSDEALSFGPLSPCHSLLLVRDQSAVLGFGSFLEVKVGSGALRSEFVVSTAFGANDG